MKARLIFYNDDQGTIALVQPNGKGRRYTMFWSVSQLVNYCRDNAIDVNIDDIETE